MTSVPRRLALRAATAHLTAQPGDAEQGGHRVVNLRVPTESDTAGTVALQVTLPADHPITGVRTSPRPGWTATTTMATLDPPLEVHGRAITEAVRTVTWTADPGVRIGPGEFADFPLSLGPLPTDTDVLVLPAVQTYDDGEVVAWDQPPAADGSEPERSAPSVTLTAPAASTEQPTVATVAGTTTAAPDDTARWLGGGALFRARRTTGADR